VGRQAAFGYGSSALFGWLVFGFAGAPVVGGLCGVLALGFFIWGLARGADVNAAKVAVSSAVSPNTEPFATWLPDPPKVDHGETGQGPPSIFVPGDADSGMVRSRTQKALLAAGREDDAATYLRETEPLRADLSALLSATRSWVEVIEPVAPVASQNSEPLATPPTTPSRPQPPSALPASTAWRPPSESGGCYVSNRSEIADGLRQLKALFDEGLLTDQEYEGKRQRLADQL